MRLTIISAILTLGLTGIAQAQQPPSWGSESSPSPTAGDSTSAAANAAADRSMYTDVNYTNAGKVGPALVVVPGEIKSSNADFAQKFGPNNIADYAELELSKANFPVLERSALGPLLQEFQLAYSLGDADAAHNYLQKGKLKTTKWVVKFDILKAEQVATQSKGFNGGALGNIAGALIGGVGGYVAGTAVGSVNTAAETGVWVIGMRYKIMDANTTEQVAQGYTEEKMEVGAKSGGALGASSSATGGVSLDTLVQRLVQKNVWEIDNRYK